VSSSLPPWPSDFDIDLDFLCVPLCPEPVLACPGVPWEVSSRSRRMVKGLFLPFSVAPCLRGKVLPLTFRLPLFSTCLRVLCVLCGSRFCLSEFAFFRVDSRLKGFDLRPSALLTIEILLSREEFHCLSFAFKFFLSPCPLVFLCVLCGEFLTLVLLFSASPCLRGVLLVLVVAPLRCVPEVRFWFYLRSYLAVWVSVRRRM